MVQLGAKRAQCISTTATKSATSDEVGGSSPSDVMTWKPNGTQKWNPRMPGPAYVENSCGMYMLRQVTCVGDMVVGDAVGDAVQATVSSRFVCVYVIPAGAALSPSCVRSSPCEPPQGKDTVMTSKCAQPASRIEICHPKPESAELVFWPAG